MKISSEVKDTLIEMINHSPYYQTIGMRIEELCDEEAIIVIENPQKVLNFYGTWHGGAIASIIDSAAGVSLIAHLNPDEAAVTIQLDIRFISPARGKLRCVGKTVKRAKNVAFEKAKVYDEEGRLVAEGFITHHISNLDNQKIDKSRSGKGRGVR